MPARHCCSLAMMAALATMHYFCACHAHLLRDAIGISADHGCSSDISGDGNGCIYRISDGADRMVAAVGSAVTATAASTESAMALITVAAVGSAAMIAAASASWLVVVEVASWAAVMWIGMLSMIILVSSMVRYRLLKCALSRNHVSSSSSLLSPSQPYARASAMHPY